LKKTDVLWILVILAISSLFVIPTTRLVFTTLTLAYPYALGFIKTAVLASMGELMAVRIRTGSYASGQGKVMKFLVWGCLGMLFVLTFKIFSAGVEGAQIAGLLPDIISDSFGSRLLTAFLISTSMNLLFAPTFMIFHRITDGYIDLSAGNLKKMGSVPFTAVIDRIDWRHFFGFVVLRTIPLFWIPAHTITFLLPEEYRVLMAAYLSIAPGIILSLAKKSKPQTTIDAHK